MTHTRHGGFRVLLLLLLACCVASTAFSLEPPPAPRRPLVVTVTDVGGSLAFMQEAFDKYLKDYPQYVSRFAMVQTPAPELPGKIKAMHDAGRSDIDLVLGGMDALAGGIQFDLWERLFPDLAEHFPGVMDSLLDPVRINVQPLSRGYGLVSGFMYNGPYLTYNPADLSDFRIVPPLEAQQLVDAFRIWDQRVGSRK